MESVTGAGAGATDLVWVMSALEHARERGNLDLVDYLRTVADDAVFEAEMAARRASLLARLG